MSSLLVANISSVDIFTSRTSNKLVVVAGEYHSKKRQVCQTQDCAMRVADWFLALTRGKLAKVLLEVDPKTEKGETANFTHVIDLFKKSGMRACIRSCDIRDLFLTTAEKNRLYHGVIPGALTYIGAPLTRALVFLKAQQHRRLSGTHDMKLWAYMDALHDSLAARQHTPFVTQEFLKELWKNVMDFYLLLEILPETTSEVICVLVGERHRANLSGVLSGNLFDHVWSQESRGIASGCLVPATL